MTIDLSKKINLVKEVLETKHIDNIQGQVVLVVDISASMTSNFRSGLVQELVERTLAIGINMDIDKKIDVCLFGEKAHSAAPATLMNISGYVRKQIENKYDLEGSTNYAPVIKLVARQAGALKESTPQRSGLLSRLFGSKSSTSIETIQGSHPTIVFFVTDGDNFDKRETKDLIRELSGAPIFWQFIGIGGSSFNFLKDLDNMDGRIIDNANFFNAGDIARISDSELYDRILNELPEWIESAKDSGIIGGY